MAGAATEVVVKSWVVFETRVRGTTVWAWGLMGDGPGFDEVYFTAPDGTSPVEMSQPPAVFGRYLFTVDAPGR